MNAHAVVNRLLEDADYRDAIYAAIEWLRRRNPTGYAQWSTAPHGIIPNYVQDDPRHPWWRSEEARDVLALLKDGAREGVKPETERRRALMPLDGPDKVFSGWDD